jgi:hypothetical protein
VAQPEGSGPLEVFSLRLDVEQRIHERRVGPRLEDGRDPVTGS